MAPKVYIETTIPSYLTARPSRDLIIAGHHQLTREWWENLRGEFDLNVSQFVIQECSAGDPEMAKRRLEALAGITVLPISSEVIPLAELLINKGPLPRKAEIDAVHISVAATNGMDYFANMELQAYRKCEDAG